MFKIEYIWRELSYRAIEEKQPYFRITDLAQRFKLSTSLVSHSLTPLRDLAMVEIGKTKSKVINAEKLLFFWATRRNLKKEIIYQTLSPLTVFEREASMPADVIPTAYTAYRFYLKDAPSDYENIYFYAYDLEEIQRRYPKRVKETPNLFILKPDPYLKTYKRIPLAQIFADLWNLPEWYAKEFIDVLLLEIKQRLGL